MVNSGDYLVALDDHGDGVPAGLAVLAENLGNGRPLDTCDLGVGLDVACDLGGGVPLNVGDDAVVLGGAEAGFYELEEDADSGESFGILAEEVFVSKEAGLGTSQPSRRILS